MEILRYSLTASVTDSKGVVYMSTEGKSGIEVAAALADKLTEHTMENGGTLHDGAQITLESAKKLGPFKFGKKLLGVKPI